MRHADVTLPLSRGSDVTVEHRSGTLRDLTIASERTRRFALTNNRSPSYLGPMTLDDAVATVQLTYPQVYHACHTRHHRKRTTEHALSARDAAILAHCG